MTMDYSPWSERENWPFLKVAVSLKPERLRPLKLVCMYETSIYTCMNFLSQFRSIFFLMTMDRKGKLAVFEDSSISETEEAPPIKIGVHAFDINAYLHEFFELILIDQIF